MKHAVSGKGGAGKSTLAAALGISVVEQGQQSKIQQEQAAAAE